MNCRAMRSRPSARAHAPRTPRRGRGPRGQRGGEIEAPALALVDDDGVDVLGADPRRRADIEDKLLDLLVERPELRARAREHRLPRARLDALARLGDAPVEELRQRHGVDLAG